jgi:hypothetical protein
VPSPDDMMSAVTDSPAGELRALLRAAYEQNG